MILFELLTRRVAQLGAVIARNHARDTLGVSSTEDQFRKSFETLVDFFVIFNQKELGREKSRQILMTAAMNGALDVFEKESRRMIASSRPRDLGSNFGRTEFSCFEAHP